MSPSFMDSLFRLETHVTIKDCCNCNCFPKRKKKSEVDLPKLSDEEIQIIVQNTILKTYNLE